MEALLKPVALPFDPVFMMLPFDTVGASCYSFLEKPRALVARVLDPEDCKDSRLFIKKSFYLLTTRSYVPQNQLQKNGTRKSRPPIYIASHIS